MYTSVSFAFTSMSFPCVSSAIYIDPREEGVGVWGASLVLCAAGTFITHLFMYTAFAKKHTYSYILATIYTLSMYLEHLSKHLSSINKHV